MPVRKLVLAVVAVISLSACDKNLTVQYNVVPEESIQVRNAARPIKVEITKSVFALPEGSVIGHSHCHWLCTAGEPLFFVSLRQSRRDLTVTEKFYGNSSRRIKIADLSHILKNELEKAGYAVVNAGGDYRISHTIPAIRYNKCSGGNDVVPTRFKLNEWSNIRVAWIVTALKSGRNTYANTFDGDFSHKKTWAWGASETPEPNPSAAIENAFGQSVRRMLADRSFPGSGGS